jgi:hypothetical protein
MLKILQGLQADMGTVKDELRALRTEQQVLATRMDKLEGAMGVLALDSATLRGEVTRGFARMNDRFDNVLGTTGERYRSVTDEISAIKARLDRLERPSR